MLRTLGISPKVLVPAIGQVVVGALFLTFGLTVEGKTALASGLATFVAGYSAPAAHTGIVTQASPPDHVDAASPS